MRVEKSTPVFTASDDQRHWVLTDMDLRAGSEVAVAEVNRQVVMYPDGAKCDMQFAQFKWQGNWYGFIVDGEADTSFPSPAVSPTTEAG